MIPDTGTRSEGSMAYWAVYRRVLPRTLSAIPFPRLRRVEPARSLPPSVLEARGSSLPRGCQPHGVLDDLKEFIRANTDAWRDSMRPNAIGFLPAGIRRSARGHRFEACATPGPAIASSGGASLTVVDIHQLHDRPIASASGRAQRMFDGERETGTARLSRSCAG